MNSNEVIFTFMAPSEEKAKLWWQILDDAGAAADEYVGKDWCVNMDTPDGQRLHAAWHPILQRSFFFDYTGNEVQMAMGEEYQHDALDENGRVETRYGKAWGYGGKTPKQAAVKLKWYIKNYTENIIDLGYSTDVVDSNETLEQECIAMIAAIDQAMKAM